MQQPTELHLTPPKELPVRLTPNDEGKVIKIELLVNAQERQKILNHFPDKSLDWKESAAHLLLLKSMAAYEEQKLTSFQPLLKKEQSLAANELAQIIKKLCHAAAPLYALVNAPFVDSPFHPLYQEFQIFKKEHPKDSNLVLSFLQHQLDIYQAKVMNIFGDAPLELMTLKDLHLANLSEFNHQLEKFSNSVFTQEQLQKLLSHQDQMDRLAIGSLGEFLRQEALLIATYGIASIDEITQERFNQLFAFSAHPLRKELVKAKSALEKQCSTHAVRYINTSSPIPLGQYEVLKGEPEDAGKEKKWMDIMPYVPCRTLLGVGVNGAEGLDQVDKILCIYGDMQKPDETFKKNLPPLYQIPYNMITGTYGAWGVLAAVIFGLPAAILYGAVLLVGIVAAMIIDLAVFAIQGFILLSTSPLLLIGILLDCILQIPSFFTKRAEIPFSLLAEMMKWEIPPKELKEIFRDFSMVRIFKQQLLKLHCYYETTDKAFAANKSTILDLVKHKQAEGVFNQVATKFFSFSLIAGFLYQKMKQLFYAIREIRKVIILIGKKLLHLPSGDMKKVHREECNDLITALKKQTWECLQKDIQAIIEKTKKERHAAGPHWIPLTPWKPRQYENLVDFISDISLALTHQVVDPAFENNPGLATPAFVASMLCSSTVLFPSIATIIPEQILGGFKAVPITLAKAFMGKELEEGISHFAINIISGFLQWKLMYFGIEGLHALSQGDIEWLKKLFENPEEITLGAMVFIALGYSAGLIPPIPLDLSVFNQNMPNNPFLKALVDYFETLYKGLVTAINAVTIESSEVSAHAIVGTNAVELAFIGLKTAMLAYALISGSHTTPTSDLQSLCKELNTLFADQNMTKEEKIKVIQDILQKHHILDSEIQTDITLSQFLENIISNASMMPAKIDTEATDQTKKTTEEQAFTDADLKLRNLLFFINQMEVLGRPLYLGSDDEGIGYQSKVDAELVYDELYFAIEDYNQSARKLGLFHAQIDGRDLLHQFYNKHCYAGSSGWHKLIFGILLFPITWLWRGFKYLIGTPSMQHQVKKSFCKDFAMFFQLIPDLVAPMLRSFLKATLYAIRMFLGVFILPLLIIAGLAMLTHSLLKGIALPFFAIYAGIRALVKKEEFTTQMTMYFSGLSAVNQAIWKFFMSNSFVNGYMKLIALIGSTTGTGSLHRLHLLKATGLATLYQHLAKEADTNSNDLQQLVYQLLTELNITKKATQQVPESFKTILIDLLKYDQNPTQSWKIKSPEREGQLADLTKAIFASAERGMEAKEKLTMQLPEGSRLKQVLAT
jgi:hypothetical protein